MVRIDSPPETVYPSSDGEPLAESYSHLYAILTTLEVLKQYLSDRPATVLADQFLYYSQGYPKLRVNPTAFKRDRSPLTTLSTTIR